MCKSRNYQKRIKKILKNVGIVLQNINMQYIN